jgi:glycosyltransferase involved in cell wall biosynthesis
MNEDLKLPPISVIMATYNGGKYLDKQLRSIFEQTVPPNEVIVCDDCSTDNTVQILERYAQQYQLRYYINHKRLGVIDNFKKALSLSHHGNYIALADQDDIWLPRKLEESARLLTQIDQATVPAFVYSDLAVIDANDRLLYASFWEETGFNKYKHSFKTLIFGNYVTGCTVVFNSYMTDHFLQMPSGIMMHDAWIGLIGFTFGRSACLQTPFIHYRRHATNTAFLTISKGSVQQNIVKILRRLFCKDTFLEEQIQLVTAFMNQYKTLLSATQIKYMKLLMQLKGKPFFYKKIVFELVFLNQWTKRL